MGYECERGDGGGLGPGAPLPSPARAELSLLKCGRHTLAPVTPGPALAPESQSRTQEGAVWADYEGEPIYRLKQPPLQHRQK